jgi:hypothetical protein
LWGERATAEAPISLATLNASAGRQAPPITIMSTTAETGFEESEHWIDLPDGVRLHAILRVRLSVRPSKKATPGQGPRANESYDECIGQRVERPRSPGLVVLVHGRLDHANKGASRTKLIAKLLLYERLTGVFMLDRTVISHFAQITLRYAAVLESRDGSERGRDQLLSCRGKRRLGPPRETVADRTHVRGI